MKYNVYYAINSAYYIVSTFDKGGVFMTLLLCGLTLIIFLLMLVMLLLFMTYILCKPDIRKVVIKIKSLKELFILVQKDKPSTKHKST